MFSFFASASYTFGVVDYAKQLPVLQKLAIKYDENYEDDKKLRDKILLKFDLVGRFLPVREEDSEQICKSLRVLKFPIPKRNTRCPPGIRDRLTNMFPNVHNAYFEAARTSSLKPRAQPAPVVKSEYQTRSKFNSTKKLSK